MKIANSIKASFLVMTLILSMFGGFIDVASAAGINVDTNDGACVIGIGQPDPYAVVYCNIQDAITDATAGDVITVADGTYIEDLIIDKAIELAGTDKATTRIRGIANVPVALWLLAIPNIDIQASDVIIHSFTIEGPDYEAGKYVSGLVLDGTDIEIYDNTFIPTKVDAAEEYGQAIITYSKTVIPSADVSGLNVHDNSFVCSGAVGCEAIYINPHTGTGIITINDNQISGSVNIGITVESGNAVVSNNAVDTNVDAESPPYGTDGIRFFDSTYGANYDNIIVSDNDVQNFKRGIRVGNGGDNGGTATTSITATIQSNTLTNNAVGIWARQYGVTSLTALSNSLAGNTKGVQNDGTTTVNAENNWWGTADNTEIAALITGDVDYEPYSTDANHEGSSDVTIVITPSITNTDSQEFDFTITNNAESGKDIKRVEILGNDDFDITSCPSVQGWIRSVDYDQDYCWYEASISARLGPGESKVFENIIATPVAEGNLKWKINSEHIGDMIEVHYPEVLTDTAGPTITIISPVAGTWYKGLINVEHTETVDNGALDSCEYNVNDGVWIVVNCNELLPFDTTACTDGEDSCKLGIKAIDTLSNEEAEYVTFSVDNSAPTISTIALSDNTVKPSDLINITSDGEDLQGIKSCTLKLLEAADPEATSHDSKNIGSDCDFEDYTIPLIDDGSYYIAIRVRNNVDEDTWVFEPITIDSTAPTFTIFTPEDNTGATTEPFTVQTSLIVEEGSGVISCEAIYEDANGNETTWELLYNNSICSGEVLLPAETPQGSGVLTVKVYDDADNVGEDSITFGFDTAGPTISEMAPEGLIETGEVNYSAIVCDLESGVNIDSIILRIQEQGISGWITQTPSITADGDDCYVINGTIDPILRKSGESYTIELYAEDNAGYNATEQWEYTVRAKYTLSLTYGRNLISLPLIPENSSIEEILGSDINKVDIIYGYDGTDFLTYNPNPAPDDLIAMEAGKGYWIYVNSPFELTVIGVSEQGMQPATYTFSEGYNLIGFKTVSADSIENRLVSGEISNAITTWNGVEWEYPNAESNLEVGRGYWIYGTTAGKYR